MAGDGLDMAAFAMGATAFGAGAGIWAVGRRLIDRPIRLARFLRISWGTQLVLADPLAHLDALSESCHPPG